MRRAGVDEFAERQLDTLSGGERQRVLLARALAQEAGVLLLDEPTAALDLKHRLLTMDTVREEVAARGALAVAAMHDLSLASRYCDRLLLLSGGRVLSEGTPEGVLTPGNLRQAFGVETVIEPDSVTGRPQVVLLGAWNGPHTRDGERPRRTGDGVTVHIICGAGSGRDLMHQLVSAGYSVTACVLGEGDADRETAERLRLAFVPSPPFSAVTAEEHVRHLRLAAAADWVVLCDMVVGRNNLPNLLAAEQAKRLLLVHGRPSRELDYTGGEASQVLARLAQRGVRVLRADVLRTLARGQAAAT
jgi:iron complex transport system ATP-binding protein